MATELLRRRQFANAAALCEDALADDPDDPELRLLLAQALMPLGRDDDANRHLREVVRLAPQCAAAYRYLGELSLRRDLAKSAEMFLRQAENLAPGDPEVRALLDLATGLSQPAAAVENFPAATAAVGCDSLDASPRRFARGTTNRPPADFDRASDLTPRIAPHPPATKRAKMLAVDTALARPSAIGFETYLLESGALTATQLRAARVYRRSRGIHLGSAVVALGFMTRQRLEGISQAFLRQRKRG